MKKAFFLAIVVLLVTTPAFCETPQFVSGSSLTNQKPALDTGDTAWVLISAALVMLMTPGLAFFYGGLVRRKNMLSILMQCFMALCIISIQ